MESLMVRPILARRGAPDWASLARDHAEGIKVRPERYFPFHDLRFSREIPALIELWNRLSCVSYFECRARLCLIAEANNRLVERAQLIESAQVDAVLGDSTRTEPVLFYYDDDDWFRPDLADIIDSVDFSTIDAAVFPFLRLASNVTTFTFTGETTQGAIGDCERFRYRYCTNNYGLTRRAITRSKSLVEHTDASQAADALGFADLQIDRIVSATSKTPCSASWLMWLPRTRPEFESYIRKYVGILEAVEIPDESLWIEQPLRQTLELFRQVGRSC